MSALLPARMVGRYRDYLVPTERMEDVVAWEMARKSLPKSLEEAAEWYLRDVLSPLEEEGEEGEEGEEAAAAAATAAARDRSSSPGEGEGDGAAEREQRRRSTTSFTTTTAVVVGWEKNSNTNTSVDVDVDVGEIDDLRDRRDELRDGSGSGGDDDDDEDDDEDEDKDDDREGRRTEIGTRRFGRGSGMRGGFPGRISHVEP